MPMKKGGVANIKKPGNPDGLRVGKKWIEVSL